MASPRAEIDPATQKLSNGRVLSYALGDVANNLSFMMTSLFLMAYMTDIAGVPAAVAGTIYGVTKIWAGVSDLIAGNTVDKLNTRWGRLRPWILFGSFPLAAVLVALFSTPAGLSGAQAVAWILLFDAAFQICYSFVNIPYGSLSAAMTQDAVDRSRLAGARSIASAVTGVLLAIVLSPQFQNTQVEGIRLKFTITTLILAGIAVCLYLICFKNTREVIPRSPGKPKLSTTLKMVRQNKPLLILCLGALFLLGAMFTMNAVLMYYARYVLGSASSFIYLQIAQTVGTVTIASMVPLMTRKLGKRVGYVMMAMVAVVAYIIIANVPAGGAGLVVAIIAFVIFGLGSGGTNAMMFSMQADTVDYGEWKTGTRSEGGSYSILSFVRKCGQGVGGWLGGIVIGLFGYVAKAPTQSEQALQGIRVATGWVPAILGVIAAVVIFFYPLTVEQHRKIVVELSERRTKRTAEQVTVGAAGAGMSDGNLVAHRPVVTINAQYGTGGAYIGEKVAEKLGVPFTGQKFSSAELEHADRDQVMEPGTNRFLWSFAHSGATESDAAIAADAESNTAAVRENVAHVLGMVKNDGGVVLGRDATVILKPMEGAFHIRLEGEVDARVARAVEMGESEQVARERLQREDKFRDEMSWRLMHWTPSLKSHYDLVVDTGQSSPDEAVDQIVHAYRQKYPNVH